MKAPSAEPKYVRPQITPLLRFARNIRHPLNRFLARQSLIGQQPVFEPGVLPQLAPIKEHFDAMRAEAQKLLEDRRDIPPLGEISPDHRRIASDGKWKSLFLGGYGYNSQENLKKCPQIARAIADTPGVVMAFLSIMEPRTHVPRHRGLTKGWLNCHLPLVIPENGRCEIAIDDELYQWKLNQWFVFDETFPHEVWNESDEPRLVLFLQVKRPMRWPGKALSKLIYTVIRRSSFVQDVRRKLGN